MYIYSAEVDYKYDIRNNPNDFDVLRKYVDSDDVLVRQFLANNTRNEEILKLLSDDPDDYVREAVAKSTRDVSLQRKLASDSSFHVRGFVAKYTDDPKLLSKFKSDPNDFVRLSYVDNVHNTNKEGTYRAFVSDPYWAIRDYIAYHTNDHELLSILSKDSDEDVRSTAKSRMRKLRINRITKSDVM